MILAFKLALLVKKSFVVIVSHFAAEWWAMLLYNGSSKQNNRRAWQPARERFWKETYYSYYNSALYQWVLSPEFVKFMKLPYMYTISVSCHKEMANGWVGLLYRRRTVQLGPPDRLLSLHLFTIQLTAAMVDSDTTVHCELCAWW